MIEHTIVITTTCKQHAATILEHLRFIKGFDPKLARDGSRFMIHYSCTAPAHEDTPAT